ncbi:transcription antiterminator BglG [Bacillus sp. FJAT-18019]|uniref:Transcription antiterminator BglG n=1 Tax=Paenibacillus solani TaxID=1705565 RepID=A0A0M1P664_9BACL|nr:PRD domain-containing protein [Paenibacillus solani]KOP67758.1 transcription antiterminator BglG [Bacillus sp. FJAT-18019]KOR89887.1 transcription antiterminator BglG [Paenibacillus solani]
MGGIELFTVVRVIGNNVVMVTGGKKESEYVILGKGIGFGAKAGGIIASDDKRIEKLFRLEDQDQWSQAHHLLEEFDPQVLEITDQILNLIGQEFPGTLNDKVYLALPSHIQFTIYRIRKGMDIINPFLEETRISFPKEYDIAVRAAELISHAFHIEVPEDEIGFLTYHVYSAVSHVPVGHLVKASNVVGKLVKYIEEERKISFDRGSMDYVRLLMHLRFSVDRILNQEIHVDNPFAEQIRTKFPYEYDLATRLSAMMEHELGKKVLEAEVCFLAMHLYRLFTGRLQQKNQQPREES